MPKPTPISRGRRGQSPQKQTAIRKKAQVHFDDHVIENSELLASLKDRERKRNAFLAARDAYMEQHTAATEAVIALKVPKGRNLRCGEFIVKVKDQKASERKTRSKAKVKVDIKLAS